MNHRHRDTIFDTLTRTLSVIRRSACNIVAIHNAALLPGEAKMRWQDALLSNEDGDDETAGSMEARLMANARPGGRL